jgi:hypothetical protein
MHPTRPWLVVGVAAVQTECLSWAPPFLGIAAFTSRRLEFIGVLMFEQAKKT